MNPDFIIGLATQLKEERIEKERLQSQIKRDEPLVVFADKVSNANNLIDIGAFAKLLSDKKISIGRNRLFGWLRENKFLRSNNEPYQQYIDSEIFKTREYTYSTSKGSEVGIKTYVTGKGQIYLTEKLRKLFSCSDGSANHSVVTI